MGRDSSADVAREDSCSADRFGLGGLGCSGVFGCLVASELIVVDFALNA